MKRVFLCVFGVALALLCAWTIGMGFRKESSAFVDDYSLSDDASVMTIHTGVGGSTGAIRKAVVSRNDNGDIMLDFISAFSGVNGSIGAKSSYEIPLDEDATAIFIYQGEVYKLILQKDAGSGEWLPVGWAPAAAR